MNIGSLPDDCLLAILNKLPLRDALSSREVNGHWNRLVLTMCRGRKNLLLFGSFRSLVDYAKHLNRFEFANSGCNFRASEMCQFSLIISGDRFAEHVVRQLMDLFPNVTNLVFFYYNWPNCLTLLPLFAHYKQNLVSLTLHGMPPTDYQQQRAWQILNEMPKLSQFHMFATSQLFFPTMPFVARLEQLTIVNYFTNVAELIKQTGPKLKKLILQNVQLGKEILELAIQQAPHLTTSLESLFVGNLAWPTTNLVVQPIAVAGMGRIVEFREIRQLARAQRRVAKAENIQVLECICDHLKHLKRVDVAFMPWSISLKPSFAKIIEQLSKLEHLESVHLAMTVNDSTLVSQENLIPLPSVKHLKLDLSPLTAEHLKHALPHLFFPTTEVEIECIDTCTLKSFDEFFSSIKWRRPKLSQGCDLRTFFSNMGFDDEYNEYLQENFGPLVHMF